VPLAEKTLIAQIRRMAKSSNGRRQNHAILAGIGDDCALLRLRKGEEFLVTTDFSLEGVHFRREWHPAESVGHRCLARGLSDIAAMGGAPVAAFLSLALPRDLPQAWVGRFLRGLMSLAKKYSVTLAGGDTAQSPDGILADMVAVGSVPKGRAVLRSGARPGDRIFVSGALGGSAAAVQRMQATSKKVEAREYARHFYPEPRVEVGCMLRTKNLASAMIDTSDGLSTDLAHLCEESGVGADVNAAAIPRARVGKAAREVDLELSLHGGEDYELLFTAPPGKHIPMQMSGVALSEIGVITRSGKISLIDNKGIAHRLKPRGWEHFKR
jgi:thiamine-monophosphate kinase